MPREGDDLEAGSLILETSTLGRKRLGGGAKMTQRPKRGMGRGPVDHQQRCSNDLSYHRGWTKVIPTKRISA